MASTFHNQLCSALSACVVHSATFQGSAVLVMPLKTSWLSCRPVLALVNFLQSAKTRNRCVIFHVQYAWTNILPTHLDEFFQIGVIHVTIEKFGPIGQCRSPGARGNLVKYGP